MPRKTRKPRKRATSPVSQDTARRQVRAAQARPQRGLSRGPRINLRPPKFPGRLGGR